MPLPPSAIILSRVLDPADIADFTVDISSLLASGEAMSVYTLSLPAESVALGLVIGTGIYAPTLSGNIIKFWLSIASGSQGNAAFLDAGTDLPVEITVDTSSAPSRKYQRTVGVTVAHL